MSPSSAFALFLGCIVLAYAGEPERAIDWANRALRVSPMDRLAYIPHHALAIAHFQCGRYEDALIAVRRAVHANPGLSVTQSWLAAVHVKLGRTGEAKTIAKQVLALQPSFTSCGFCAAVGALPAVAQALTEAWHEAGLPP